MEREVSGPFIVSDYLQAFLIDPVVLRGLCLHGNCSSVALLVLFKYEVIIISKLSLWEGGGRGDGRA